MIKSQDWIQAVAVVAGLCSLMNAAPVSAASVEMTVKKMDGFYYGNISVYAQGATSAVISFPAYSMFPVTMQGSQDDFHLDRGPLATLPLVLDGMNGTVRITVSNGTQESILAFAFNPANVTDSDFPVGSVAFTSPVSGSVDQSSNLTSTWALSGGLSGNDVDGVVLERYGSGSDVFLSTMNGDLAPTATDYAWTNLASGSHTMGIHYANILDDVAGTLVLEKNELGLTLEAPDHVPGGQPGDVLVAVMVSDTVTFSVPEPASLSLLTLGAMGLLARRRA